MEQLEGDGKVINGDYIKEHSSTQNLKMAHITMAVTYIAGIVYFIS